MTITAIKLIFIIQNFSQICNSVIHFILGIKLFQKSQNIFDYSLIFAFQLLPGMMFLFPAGILIDKFSRVKILFYCDLASIIFSLILLLWLYNTQITTFFIYLYVSCFSLISSIHGITFVSVISSNVSTELKNKTAVLITLQRMIPRLISPLFAGVAFTKDLIDFIIILDILSFLFAALVSWRLKESDKIISKVRFKGSSIELIKSGLTYIIKHPRLIYLLILLLVSSLTVSFLGAYTMPIALLKTSPDKAGMAISVSGIGAIIGGVLYGLLYKKILNTRLVTIYCLIIQGLILFLSIFINNSICLVLLLFSYFFFEPIQKGTNYALWQHIIPPHMYGRVFSIVRFLQQLIVVVTFLFAGVLGEEAATLTHFIKEAYVNGGFSDKEIKIRKEEGMLIILSIIGFCQIVITFFFCFKKNLIFIYE